MNLAKERKKKLDQIKSWCIEKYGSISLIHSPTNAELSRVSYDNCVSNIVVFYFREDEDYFFFLLKWQ